MNKCLAFLCFLGVLASCKKLQENDTPLPNPAPRLVRMAEIDTSRMPADTLSRERYLYDAAGRVSNILTWKVNGAGDTTYYKEHRIEYGADTMATRSILFTRTMGAALQLQYDTVYYRYAGGRLMGDSAISYRVPAAALARVRKRSFLGDWMTENAITMSWNGAGFDTVFSVRKCRQERVGVYLLGQVDTVTSVTATTMSYAGLQTVYEPSVTPNPFYPVFKSVRDDLPQAGGGSFPQFAQTAYLSAQQTLTASDWATGTAPVSRPPQTVRYRYVLRTDGWPSRLIEQRTSGSVVKNTVYALIYQ